MAVQSAASITSARAYLDAGRLRTKRPAHATYLYDEQTSESAAAFQPVAVTAGNGHNERWLQERIFELPALLPMTAMFGHGESFVPLCRELPLRYGSSSVFLDILGVSATGRLVLSNPSCGATPKLAARSSRSCSNMHRCYPNGRIATLKRVSRRLVA